MGEVVKFEFSIGEQVRSRKTGNTGIVIGMAVMPDPDGGPPERKIKVRTPSGSEAWYRETRFVHKRGWC